MKIFGLLDDRSRLVPYLRAGFRETQADFLVVLAGGAHGYFRPGRLVEYDNDAAFSDMLAMCFQYMGFADVTTFGDERLSNGGISGIT